MEVLSEERQERRIGGFEVFAQARTLLFGQAEFNRPRAIKRLTQLKELFGGGSHDRVRTIRGLYVPAAEGLLVLYNQCQQTREITVFDTWHERFVLAERTGQQHA